MRGPFVLFALFALLLAAPPVQADEIESAPYEFLDKAEGPPLATRPVLWPPGDKELVATRLAALRAKVPGLFARAALYGRVAVYRAMVPPRGPVRELTAWHDRPTPSVVVNPAAFAKKDDAAARLDWDLVRAFAGCADPLWHAARSKAWHDLAAQWKGGPRGMAADSAQDALVEYVAATVLPDSPLLPKDKTVPEPVAAYVRAALLAPGASADDDVGAIARGYIALYRRQEPDEALKLVDEVLKRNAKNADALYLKATVLLRRNAAKEAEAVLSATLAALGEHEVLRADVLVERGRVYAMLRKMEEAKADFEQAIAVDEGKGAAWYFLGVLHLQEKQPDNALNAFGKAIERLSANAALQSMAYRYRGRLRRLHEKDTDGALEDYTKAAQLNGRNTYAWLGRADILLSQQKFRDALFGYMAVLRQDKKHAGALAGMARAQRGMGSTKAAAKTYAQAIEAAPKSLRLRAELGEVKAELGDLEGAVALFTEVIERLKKPRAEVRLQRGIAYVKLERFADAIADLEKAASVPKQAEAAGPWLEQARTGAEKLANTKRLLDALAPDEGVLVLDAPEGAQVVIDRKDRGTKRAFTFGGLADDARQPHYLTLRLPDGGKAKRTFFVARGTITRLTVHARSTICVKYENKIQLIHPEDGTRKALTGSTLDWARAAMSPDGRHVAAAVRPRKKGSGLADYTVYVLPVDGGARREVGPGFQPIWSPDGKQLCYERSVRGYKEMKASKDWKGYYDICVAGALDGTPRRLTEGQDPVWAPDGTRIVFTRPLTKRSLGPRAIFTIRPDGRELRRLHQGAGPTWSPDGSRIAFSHKQGENDERGVYLMKADGSEVRRVVTGGSARWSPDGAWIAYRKEESGGLYTSWVVTPSGQGRRRIGDASQAHWSPDGLRLVVGKSIPPPRGWTEKYGATDLEVVNRDGSGRRRLTRYARIIVRKGQPDIWYDVYPGAWSPHGTHLAYMRFHGEDFFLEMLGESDVRVIAADGSGDRQLLPPTPTDTAVIWQ